MKQIPVGHPRNALVMLDTSQAAKKSDTPRISPSLPADQIGAKPTRLPGSPPLAAPPLASAATAIGKTAAAAMKPTRILSQLENGEAEIRIPGVPGKYGHGLASYEVKEDTVLSVKVHVRDAKVDAKQSRIVIDEALATKLFVKLEGLSLRPSSDGHAKVEIDLGRFPDFVVNRFLDLEDIPLAIAELCGFVEQHAATFKDKLPALGGPLPFDAAAFEIDVKDAVFKPGALPIGPDAALVLAPGNRITASGDRNGLRVEGALRFAELEIHAGDSFVTAGPATAEGSVFVALDADMSPKDVRVDLQGISGTITGVRLQDANGNMADLDEAQIANARLSTNFHDGKQRVSMHIPEVSARMNGAKIQAQNTTLDVQGAKMNGSFSLLDDVLAFNVRSAELVVNAQDVTLGDGALKIAYGSLGVGGRGEIDFDGQQITLQGALNMRGVVEDAQIGQAASPFSLTLSAGSEVALSLDQLSIGPRGSSFTGRGEFQARIDRGSVLLPSGEQAILAPGSTASVRADGIDFDAQGLAASGRIEIDGGVMSSLGEGVAKVVLDQVSLEKSGAFKIGSANAEISAVISGVTGKLKARPVPEASKPALVMPALALTPLDAARLLDGVADCGLEVGWPVPAGTLGVWPAKATIAPGTVARFELQAKDGSIDRENIRLVFEPPIKGPLWIAGNGIKVNRKGDFIVDLKGMPNFNLSRALFGMVRAPKTLAEVPVILAKLDQAIQATIGRVFTLPPMPGPQELLELTHASITASDVRLNGQKLALGHDAYIVPKSDARFTLTANEKEISLQGKVGLADLAFSDPKLGIRGLQGEADVAITLRDKSVEANISGLNAQAKRLSVATEAGTVELSDAAVNDGAIHLRTEDGKTGSVQAKLGTMQANVHAALLLDEGELKLPNGTTLKIAGDTHAELTINELSRQSGDGYATLDGSLSFEAKLSGEASAGSALASTGVNEGVVRVTVSKVKLAPDGSYVIDDASVTIDASAQGLSGSTKS